LDAVPKVPAVRAVIPIACDVVVPFELALVTFSNSILLARVFL